ncbi:hypothetical protein J6590_020598 [Homalodisca vitripennis]|nr:hypothetical protein J6590_020598 [Homalodisca vitripennis]
MSTSTSHYDSPKERNTAHTFPRMKQQQQIVTQISRFSFISGMCLPVFSLVLGTALYTHNTICRVFCEKIRKPCRHKGGGGVGALQTLYGTTENKPKREEWARVNGAGKWKRRWRGAGRRGAGNERTTCHSAN